MLEGSEHINTQQKAGNTRGENPRDWAKKANDIVEQYFKKEGFPIIFSTHGVTETTKKGKDFLPFYQS